MRKKKISLIGIFIFIFLFLCEINNINLNEIYSNLINKNNKDTIVETNKPEEIKPNIVESNLNVYFINVGQADCILIQNNDENMLIDAGNNEDGEKLVKYFKTLGITKFKYIVGTHPHEDHIGGLDDIINEFEIEEVLLPDAYTTTKTFEEVLDAIESKNLEITVPEINSNIDLGEAKIKVIYTESNPDDLNDASIVLRLDFGESSFLFTGDATTRVEKQILDKELKVDVYKVAHHGSSYSNSKVFLDKVNPKYGIISCEKDNSYGHPHKEVIERLNHQKVTIYKTYEDGTIIVSSDGKNITINNTKTDTNG